MIPHDEWLKDAKRLPVGHSARVYHGAERRPNLVVRNLVDRYVCWCHACHDGAVSMKEVVKLTNEAPQPKDHKPKDPGTLVQYSETPEYMKILGFLHSKGLHAEILNKTITPYLSKKDQRLVFTTPDQVVGRDLSGQSKAKWYTYTQVHSFNRASFDVFKDKIVFVTEDYFSALKGQYAALTANYSNVLFVASMGTVLHPDLLLELTKANLVVMMYDNDKAGIEGTNAAIKTLHLLGIRTAVQYPHTDKDPKDMEVLWYQDVIKRIS